MGIVDCVCVCVFLEPLALRQFDCFCLALSFSVRPEECSCAHFMLSLKTSWCLWSQFETLSPLTALKTRLPNVVLQQVAASNFFGLLL